MRNEKAKKEKERGVFDRLFPPKYDFHQMLTEQAAEAAAGCHALHDWLKNVELNGPSEIIRREKAIDEMRHDMEAKLQQAFSTPFDRREIYSLSHQMGEILDFAMTTYLEMKAFELKPDDAILSMARALHHGVDQFYSAVQNVIRDPVGTEALIRDIRKSEHELENIYIDAMARLFKVSDTGDAMKKREIYHHLKDAGRTLSATVDTLHRVVVNYA